MTITGFVPWPPFIKDWSVYLPCMQVEGMFHTIVPMWAKKFVTKEKMSSFKPWTSGLIARRTNSMGIWAVVIQECT